MPLDIAVSRQYGDSTVTLRTNLPVTTGKGPVPLATVPVTTEAPAGGGVGRLVSTASFFGDEGVPREGMLDAQVECRVLRHEERLLLRARRDGRRGAAGRLVAGRV